MVGPSLLANHILREHTQTDVLSPSMIIQLGLIMNVLSAQLPLGVDPSPNLS
jgi:hypothetical protein